MRKHKLLILLILFILVDVIISFYFYAKPAKQPTVNGTVPTLTPTVIKDYITPILVSSEVSGFKVQSVNSNNLVYILNNLHFYDSFVTSQTPKIPFGTKVALEVNLVNTIEPNDKLFDKSKSVIQSSDNYTFDQKTNTLNLFLYQNPQVIASSSPDNLNKLYSVQVLLLLSRISKIISPSSSPQDITQTQNTIQDLVSKYPIFSISKT